MRLRYEALVDILIVNSCKKYNIVALNENGNENSKKTNKQTQGLISRKINFAGAHFFDYFALVSHDYNVKRVFVPSFFSFSLPLIFTVVAASIPHLFTAAIKFSCFSSSEIRSILFIISRSSSFSVIHVGVRIKI